MHVPTLDFSQFIQGTEEQRATTSHALVQSFRDHGFVKLVKHGISDETIAALSSWVRHALEVEKHVKT